MAQFYCRIRGPPVASPLSRWILEDVILNGLMIYHYKIKVDTFWRLLLIIHKIEIIEPVWNCMCANMWFDMSLICTLSVFIIVAWYRSKGGGKEFSVIKEVKNI